MRSIRQGGGSGFPLRRTPPPQSAATRIEILVAADRPATINVGPKNIYPGYSSMLLVPVRLLLSLPFFKYLAPNTGERREGEGERRKEGGGEGGGTKEGNRRGEGREVEMAFP